jgi:acetyl esterase/lipase
MDSKMGLVMSFLKHFVRFGTLLIPCVVAPFAVAQPLTMKVWPGETVGDHGSIGPQRVRSPEEAPTPNAIWVTNVSVPTISVFRPDPARNTGAALIICPGGGYWNLAWNREGEDIAAWANSVGMTGIVLKYRVPRREGEPERLPAPGPLLDAQRTVSLVRHHAATWGIDPEKIGIVGFSAGGHLAVMTATSFEQRAYEAFDAIDQHSCQPNFAVVAYTGYITKSPQSRELAEYIKIPPRTCPIFIVHATDDDEPGAPPEQSLALYSALRHASIPVEMHLYEEGKHGFGMQQTGLPVSSWPERCEEWLTRHNILPHNSSAQKTGEAPRQLSRHFKGIAANYIQDVGIAQDSRVLFHDDFETGSVGQKWDRVYHHSNLELTTEKDKVLGGQRSLEITVPQSEQEVSNELVKRFTDGHPQLFLRYYSKFELGFDQIGSSHNGGFVSAIASTIPFATPGQRADGKNKFTAALENWRGEAETASPGHLNVYCYHPKMRSDYGDHFFPTGLVLPFSAQPANYGSEFIPRLDIVPDLGRWHCYELMVQANAAGKANGRITFWFDGKLAADFPNLQLRDTEELQLNYAGIGLHVKQSPNRANRKWYDDVVIATSYIGPKTEEP